ncbi:MAG: hypothetical protein R2839_07000 [Thermomicrobiales bacterium]
MRDRRLHLTLRTSPGAFAGNTADFVNWAGWLAPFDRPIVLVLDDDSRFDGWSQTSARIGLDSVVGYLRGGMRSWTEVANRSSHWQRSPRSSCRHR